MIGSDVSGSDKLSMVSGRLFTMFSASVNGVRSYSSSRCWAWSSRRPERTERTVQLSRCHMPPIRDADGTFISNLIRSKSSVTRNSLTESVFTSLKAALRSFPPSTKFVHWSHLNSRILPLRLMNRLRALINASDSIKFKVKKCIGREQRQVKIKPSA